MATTYNDNGGAVNGSNKEYTFSFAYIKTEDVKVALNGITQASTKYAISTSPTKITFNNTSVDSTVQESTGAPKTGVTVRVYRDTEVDTAKAVYAAGSSVRAVDLNNNQEQVLFALQEEQDQLERLTNADINPTAEIEVSKLKDGTARQVLQTDAAGTGVEWTSNVDIPGTLDVTGAVDFDNNLTVDGTSTLTGNVTVGGTVDGRDVAADGTKLDGIEAGATADQTSTEIVTAVQGSNIDLSGTLDVTGATTLDSTLGVNGLTTITNGLVLKSNGEKLSVQNAAGVEKFYVDTDNGNSLCRGNLTIDGTVDGRDIAADGTKLDGIETAATADQTGAEIKTAYEANSNTNAYTDAEKTKLSGIATGAEVNVQSDWNASSGDAQILNKPVISSVSGINDLSDVDTTGVANDKILKYVAADSKWKVADDATGGGGSALTVVDESTTLTTAATKFTFTGAGVTATEPSSDEITVTIPGSSGGASAFTGLSDTPGSMGSAGQHLKVNSSGNALEFTAAPSGTTNLSNTANGTSLTVESSSGNNTALPAATTSAWGVMTDDDKTKLDGIATSATAVGGANSVTFNDDVNVEFGTNNDGHIRYYNSGLNSWTGGQAGAQWVFSTLSTGTDTTPIRFYTKSVVSGSAVYSQYAVMSPTNKDVALFYNGNQKFITTNTGVTVTGTVAATAYTGDGSALTGVATPKADGCIYENSQTISNNYTIASGKGAHSVGPITVNNCTVTVIGNWVVS